MRAVEVVTMKWMEERDALIAQTMAFVRSVTGKKDEPVNALEEPGPRVAESAATSHVQAEVESSGVRADALGPLPLPPAISSPAEPVRMPEMARPEVSGDIRAELKERVASFRKHQERFNRERDEYFSATLARARAGIKEVRPPRVEK
jgi:hypothetical protein